MTSSRILRQWHAPLAASAALFSSALTETRADWPNYRGPNHDGISAEKLKATTFPSTGPRQVWKAPSSGGFSSFSVAGNRAYTIVRRDVDGAPSEVLVALDAQTGKEVWAHAMAAAMYGHDGGNAGTPDNSGGDGPRSTPAIDGSFVYALDANLRLVCLEAASGKPVWQRDIIAEHAGRNISWKNAASPVIDGDLIFVAGGGDGQALLAIHKQTGKTVWKGQDDKMTHATPVVATLHGQRQVIFLTQSGLVALATQTGDLLWRQKFDYKVSTAASPIVAGDIVYCSAGYGVGAGAYRISKKDGAFASAEIWRKPGKLENHWSTPVYRDGHLYGIFGFKEYGKAPLKCIELATGVEKWSAPGFGPGNVTLVGDHLVVLGDAGQLAIVEATPGEFREKAKADVLGGKCWTTPTYTSGKIFARSTTEAVCVELQ